MAISKKAVQARRNFRNTFSRTTAEILRMVAQGKSTHQIADQVGIPVTSVVTTRGNYTRGVYAPYVYPSNGDVVGTCEF